MKTFSVNGCVGYGAYCASDFPEVSCLLRHMDYLGIDRSLVWHLHARDCDPAAGNRKLIDAIKAQENAGQRLLPSFVVTPSDLYERGAMDAVGGYFAEGYPKSLRIFPKTSRFAVRTIERVFKELSCFKPTVLWSFRDSNGDSDVLEFGRLARKFQDMNFVLTELMWPEFNDAVDLMWRAENIRIDVSWLHMGGAVEFLCDEFGAERILFGLGLKAHYGAAIANVNHAKIGDRERGLIFSGNAERMLNMECGHEKLAKSPGLLAGKPVWESFREGNPVRGARVIDSHAHVGPHTRGWIIKGADAEDYLQTLMLQMDSCGVDSAVVSADSALFGEPLAGNLEVENLLSKHPDRFKGYFVFNPLYREKLVPALDEAFARGFFVGYKILSSYWMLPVDDAAYAEMWEHADRHGLPVLIHTWDDVYCSPAMLHDICRNYPGALFLLGHSGGGDRGRQEAVELALENPNVFCEFCGSFTARTDWKDTIGQIGVEKVVFGSDAGAHSLAWELGRFLSIPLPDKELIPALAENFIGITRKRIFAPE